MRKNKKIFPLKLKITGIISLETHIIENLNIFSVNIETHRNFSRDYSCVYSF